MTKIHTHTCAFLQVSARASRSSYIIYTIHGNAVIAYCYVFIYATSQQVGKRVDKHVYLQVFVCPLKFQHV